jgi:tetratricopeptide (TPR) repeat protein
MTAERVPVGGELSLSFETAALAGALLGRDLPAEAENELLLAGLAYQSDAIAERHLRRARALAPDHAAVLIGLYRFYFYKNRLEDALTIARLCLAKAARDNGFDPTWRRVEAEDADFGSYDAILPRFYLFTLKAYAYLQLRLGHIEEGRDAAMKTVSLDPTDKVGARVLLDVLGRAAMDEAP